MQMQLKPQSKRMLYIIILTELLLGLGLLGYSMLKKPVLSRPTPTIILTKPFAPPEVIRKSIDAGAPVRLKIAKINVDAVLDHMGVTAGGELEAPKKLANAAWYALGPRPGNAGSAVINGHFGSKDNSAVFDNLHTLQPDDTISIEDERGVSIAFIVRKLRTYNPDDDTTSVFASSDGKAHLNLITCQGVWDSARKSFSARLVVFTDKTQ